MRFYRVRLYTDHGSSAGFEWVTARADAERIAREKAAEEPEEVPPEIDIVDIAPTKQGILRALNHYAGEPQNG